jgi:iron(III) transport system ATP-binding protein
MLDIAQLKKSFKDKRDQVQAVNGIDLSVRAGEFLVLLGPSGCGKTTTLRMIAGLERPDEGEITIDELPVYSARQHIFVPPEKRPISMVFQSYAIWPHLSVYDNVALPLRLGHRRLSKEERERRVQEVLELLGLEGLADRKVTALSGGQQQRVSLARAIAQRPKVLLMDEPLSNLDYKLRVRLRSELKALMSRLHLTTVYVTHDQEEALAMGDRIAVLNYGKMIQLGSPQEVYQRPLTEFVARFIGEMNFISGEIRHVDQDHVHLETALGRLAGVVPRDGCQPKVGERRMLGIRPSDIQILPQPNTPQDYTTEGAIVTARYLGESIHYTVQVGQHTLQVKTHHSVVYTPHDPVTLKFDPRFCIVVEPDES